MNRSAHHPTIAIPGVLALALGASSIGGTDGAQAAPSRQITIGALTAESPLPGAIWVETLGLSSMEQEWGTPQAAHSVDGHPLTIGGIEFAHGIGSHANGELVLALEGAAVAFHAAVGVDREVGERGSVAFAVLLDGKEVARTPVLHGGDDPYLFSVDLRGARELTLAMEDGGDGIDYDHADWGGAMLALDPAATRKPHPIAPPEEPVPDIIHPTPPEPAIHAPLITGATPGRPFLFRIPATGEPPLTFQAIDLPSGLRLDPGSGIITGALREAGRFEVRLVVEGPAGTATSTLTIVGGQHKLALTPPMGWNSWNVWGTSIDADKVRAAADWMIKSGLAAHGFQYINIDDAWEGGRDDEGRVLTNEKFPDMKALSDYVHARGLKLGIYSSPGPKTCAGYEGTYDHEFQDARTWADWGIDLIKYDWCSYGQIAKDQSLEELQKPYLLMRKALDACGRDIVFSLCQYGMGKVWEWGGEVGGNYWRTTGDIRDSWSSLSSIGFAQAGHEKNAGPGHWNDPDMLVVGKVGWGPSLHPSNLKPNEQVTHITLWSLLAAPLLIGCDLSQIDDLTLALLTNTEVLEVNQDPLGRQARRVRAEGKLEVWARPLADGTHAVGLFNRGRREAEVTLRFSEIGTSGPKTVRDLWLQQEMGVFTGSYTSRVPRHGAVMIKVGR